MVSVVGVPIAFVGSGERLEDLEAFHPDRVVSRLLGMGDVLSLIEKAEEAIDVADAQKLEQKLRQNDFTLEDFREQLRTIRKMGPLESILGMMPGMGNMKQLADQKPDEKQLNRVEAIIGSMTLGGAPAARGDQRQPPETHRAGQRHDGGRSQPVAEAVRADEEDAEAAGRDAGGGGRRGGMLGMLRGRR